MNRQEREFIQAPTFIDVRGYVWQRLRKGAWRSTDGLPPRDYAQVLWAPEPPAPWGPYIQVVLTPVVREPAGGGD